MTRAHWTSLLALAVIVSLAGTVAAATTPECRMVKAGELPVKFVNNRPLVSVSINGKPGWFLIDTGAANSVMFGGAATSYGLNRHTAGVRFWGVGGGQEADAVVISQFGLSDVKVKDVPMFVLGHRGSPDEAGILGRDFLSLFDIEFDLASKAVRLWRPQDCGSQSLAYWTTDPGGAQLWQEEKGGEYKVRVLVNGRPVDATLDSGASKSVVTPEVASIAGIRKQDYTTEVTLSSGIGENAVKTQVALFNTLTVGTEQVSHARLEVADMFAADTEMKTGSIVPHRIETPTPTMLLGADFLRSHRVLLAADQHRLYFTYSGGPVFDVVGDAAPRSPSQALPSAALTASQPAMK